MKNFQNFDFQMKTEIIFGKDTELRTGELIKKFGGKKVMIICDAGDFIKKCGLFDRVAKSITDAGLEYVELDGILPNPRLSKVHEGVELARKENVDFFLAIGGGSTIDSAKGIAMGVNYDGDVFDFFNGTTPANQSKMAPLATISTMAGTGAETSAGAVLYDDITTKRKLGSSNHLRAVFAIMNPELTYSLPKGQTAAGATDILAHPFDTYFTYNTSYLGDKYCEAAMKTAVTFGPIALQDPTNYEARAELLIASSFAQNDVSRIGRTLRHPNAGGGHQIERQLTGYLDTPHGCGLSVMMPALLQYWLENDETTLPKICQFATNVFDVPANPLDPKAVAQEGIKRFKNWLASMNMPLTIHDLARREITDEEIDYLVSEVKYRPEGYMMGFGHLTKEDVKKVYESVR